VRKPFKSCRQISNLFLKIKTIASTNVDIEDLLGILVFVPQQKRLVDQQKQLNNIMMMQRLVVNKGNN